MNSDLKNIISSSGINFLFRIFGLGTSFLILAIIARLYGLDVSGNYGLAFTIAQAAAMLLALGIPHAIIKMTGNHRLSYQQARKLLVKGLKITFLASFLPAMFFFFFADFFAENVFENKAIANYFRIMAFSVPLFVFHELFLYFFIATKNFTRYSLLMFVIPNILLAGFLYLFYTLGYPEHYTFLAFALSIVLAVVLEAVLVFEFRPEKATVTITGVQLLKTASPMMFGGLFLYLLNWTDTIILGMMVDEKQVGIYYSVFKVGSVGSLIIISVNIIIMPRMAELYGKGDLAGLKKLVHSSTWLVGLLSLPLTAGLILFAPFILSFFGTEAVEGTTAMIIIAAGVFFGAACGNVDQILNMSNNAKVFRNITIVFFFVNAILNYILIPFYGINGSAAASLITNILLNIVCVFYIKKKLGFYTFI